MSLTEREKEIALESFDNLEISIRPKDAIAACDLFLSRIREEQEPVAWRSFDTLSREYNYIDSGIGNYSGPLFTIPPAAPECKDLEMIKRIMATGTADSFMSLDDEQKRMAFAVGVHESTLRKKLNDSCEELVEALEIVNLFCCRDDAYTGGWVNYSNKPEISPQDIVVKALANHAKRMKGEE